MMKKTPVGCQKAGKNVCDKRLSLFGRPAFLPDLEDKRDVRTNCDGTTV